mgnify:CR=1 FL=1
MSFYVRGGYSAAASECKTLSDACELAEKISSAIDDKKLVHLFGTSPIISPVEILNEQQWHDASRC